MKAGQQLEALGQAELIHGSDLGGDNAEDEIDPEPLPNDACAETPELVRIGEIDVAALLELRSLGLGEEARGQSRRVLGGQFRHVRPDRLQVSVEAPDRGRIDAEMNIGSAT